MDEEKKELREEQKEAADVEISAAKSLFSFPSEIKKEREDVPTVSNKPDKREDKKREKKEKNRQQKNEREKKYPDKLSFLLGLVILIFAVIGVVLTVWNGVTYINSIRDTGSEYADYNAFLTPIAAVDPDAFDDITAASQEQLLNAAIWSILSIETTPDTYSYSGGFMLIPADDVASAFVAMFGPEVELSHTSVQGYNCTFEYDTTAKVYKIPVTTIMPIYTPQVTEVSKSGTSLVVTVNYLPAESWAKDDEGNMITPEADKVMKITFRELQGSYYISAIQTVSSTVPEVIIPEGTTAAEIESQIQEPETTTVISAEKSTLGGRV